MLQEKMIMELDFKDLYMGRFIHMTDTWSLCARTRVKVVAYLENTVCIGRFCQNDVVIREMLQKRIRKIMNGLELPRHEWTRCARHSIACDGLKVFTVSSSFKKETREAVLNRMINKLNGVICAK